MKVLKRAEQRNVIVDKSWYTEAEINALKSVNYCFMLTHDNDNLRIDLSYAGKLDIVYDKNYGVYVNELVMCDSTRIRVLLQKQRETVFITLN